MNFSARRPARIAIIEDHPLVRRGLSAMLEQEHDLTICGVAGTTSEALTLVEEHRPHLAIIDLTLEEGSGLELIRQLRAAHSETRMLVVSMHDEIVYAERVLRAGASGYVHKNEPADTVLAAIRTVLDGRVFVSDEVNERILRRVSASADAPTETPLDTLSDRELQVLDLLGRGLTTRDIAEHLFLSPKTVHTYRDHLKTKLGLKSANELVRFAHARAMDETGGAPEVSSS